MKILGTGLSGLVGSRLVELLSDRYKFETITHKNGIDIRDKKSISSVIESSSVDIVLHAAAKTNVDACEDDKKEGKKGEAWQINVVGTENIVEACKKSHKKIIYISTDFVFDGNPKDLWYSEESQPHPINWYGQTKYEAEKLIATSLLPFLIVRTAYPYRAHFETKEDFVKTILTRLREGTKIQAVTDHIMTPTFIDDIACAVNQLITDEATGIYHVVGSQFITPEEAATLIAKVFSLDSALIKKTTRKDYFAGKAPRPFNLSLRNDKIQKLGSKMLTFEEGLFEVRRQLKNYK